MFHVLTSIISYDLNDFNQGFTTMRDLILSVSPDAFLMHEQWLTPDNISKLDSDFVGYFAFVFSAMNNMVNCAVLR